MKNVKSIPLMACACILGIASCHEGGVTKNKTQQLGTYNPHWEHDQ